MTAISSLRAKAAEKFGGYPVEFDSGKSIRLKSLMELTESELAAFDKAQKTLTERDDEDSQDFAALERARRDFAACLIAVSDDKTLANKELAKESLGVLMAVFNEYAETLKSATKSEDAGKSS